MARMQVKKITELVDASKLMRYGTMLVLEMLQKF